MVPPGSVEGCPRKKDIIDSDVVPRGQKLLGEDAACLHTQVKLLALEVSPALRVGKPSDDQAAYLVKLNVYRPLLCGTPRPRERGFA